MGQVALDVGSDLAPPVPGKDLPAMECLLVGGFAACVSRTATAPLERIKIQAQTRGLAGSVIGELGRIVKTEGAKALFAGNGANLIRVFPFAGIVTLAYVRLIKILPCDDEWDPMEPVYRATAGGVAGTIGTLATYPIDVVRARLTVDGPKYGGSIAAVARSIVKEDGYRGLYRGLTPTLCAVAPFLAIQQSCYDSVKRISLDAGLEPSVPLFMGCSMAAGALAQTVVYPLDLIRRRVQMGAAGAGASASVVSDATWMASLRNVIAQEGVRGVMAGITPTFAKVIPSVMITKTVADSLIAYGDRHGWRG